MRVLFAMLFAGSLLAAERFPFVIPGDDGLKGTATDMSGLSPKPAGDDGFVRIRDGRFWTESERLRIWGVNVCYGGNFPRTDDAPKIAAHLAKLGINGVRFHHHDSQNSPKGLWKRGLVDGKRVFDPDAVARLDLFLAELHKHGIYANLNLHCSRELKPEEGFPNHNVGWRTGFNKYTMYFDPGVQAEFKRFCRDYLLHVNPHRGLRRVDDPGIAMLEITNENSFSKLGPDIARKLPDPYRANFRQQWNTWLRTAYADDAALRAAWGEVRNPVGAPIASSQNWQKTWIWKNDNFSATFGDKSLRIEIAKIAEKQWQQQLLRQKLDLKAGEVYTLRFRYRGDGQEIQYGVETAWPAEWKSRGAFGQITCQADWQTFEQTFAAVPDAHPARFSFSFGGQQGAFEIADFTLSPGGDLLALGDGQTLAGGNIAIPGDGSPLQAQDDVHRFMRETELKFVREMKRFLREDLGVKVPISATQLNYHPPEIAVASESDFADLHSYWHHPLFPGKMWDPTNWVIRNKAIEANPFDNKWPGNSMLMRAGWRIFDRPFTYSEWNSGEPMIFGTGLVPIAATIASLQDWDAIFFFQYDERNDDPFRDHFRGHFSMNGQPAKLAMLTAAANLFRRGDLAPLADELAGPVGEDLVHGGHAVSHRIGMRAGAEMPAHPKLDGPLRSSQITWDHEAGVVQVHTDRTWLVQGMIAEKSFRFGETELVVGPCENNYGIIILTSLDDKPIAESARLLLAAVGSAENTGMQWNADKTSVDDNWGTGPTVVNPIPCELRNFPARKIHVLDGRGQRTSQVTTFKAKTLWYELTE